VAARRSRYEIALRCARPATEFRCFVGRCAEASPPALRAGELDETGRSSPVSDDDDDDDDDDADDDDDDAHPA
jgi:hypothetical protein